MPTISSITVYPLKSAAGVVLDEAAITDTGLAHDREWMVIDADDNFVTQREFSKLALVQPLISGGTLSLRAPGMSDIALPDASGAAVDCGLFGETCKAFRTSADVDGWISDYLGVKSAIVSRDRGFLRKGGVQYPARDERPTTFVDNYGILIISKASLDDLNARLDAPVPMDRFRPNIVIDGVPAYGEEFAKMFASPTVELSFTNVCTRCVLPNIDQRTGAIGREPFKTLSSFRFDEGYRGVRFGAYAAVATGIGGTLKVGDTITVH